MTAIASNLSSTPAVPALSPLSPNINSEFVRDSSVWIGRNFLTASMTYPVRLPAGLRVLEPDRDTRGLAREQWDDGNNVLAVAPNKVIAYESNELTNRYLEEQGIDVIRVPGSELRRARGGPHCLSCPITRGETRTGTSA